MCVPVAQFISVTMLYINHYKIVIILYENFDHIKMIKRRMDPLISGLKGYFIIL